MAFIVTRAIETLPPSQNKHFHDLSDAYCIGDGFLNIYVDSVDFLPVKSKTLHSF